tara:strand:- start:458 stop:883 length:426 start_codon:yes stop_codon:yes gene_type:complete
MFNFFKKKKVEEDKPKNLDLISLCLAFEVANADNDIDEREQKIFLAKIKETIDLSVLTEKEIFNVIEEEGLKRISFYEIIQDINNGLNKDEKINILKLMWEIAYADDILDIEEEKIIRRSAEMLGINPSIVLQTKQEFKKQ